MLDPQARWVIDLMIERAVPPVHTLTPTEARRLYRERRGFTQPEPPAIGAVQDIDIPGPAGPVPCRLYKPAPVTSVVPDLPVLVYFHGGGWVIGDRDTHDVLCRQLCAAAHCAVLSVDYRLAPEHAFPAAPDDCFAATRWVQSHGHEFGLNGKRLAVGGDSAGGNLAATVAIMLRDAGGGADTPAPLLQLLIYPATDMRALAPSHTHNGQGYMLTSDSVAYYRGHYMPGPGSWADWRASPLLAPSLAGLPPALVLTAGYDPLRDEGREYADALSRAGVPTQYVCFERQIHGFITMSKVIAEANTAVALCAGAVKGAFTRAA